ncbi:MAG: hypothetical protein ACO1N1_06200 [Dyadobacter fermentans]
MKRGTYRIDGDLIDIFPADSEYKAVQLILSNGLWSMEVLNSICNRYRMPLTISQPLLVKRWLRYNYKA